MGKRTGDEFSPKTKERLEKRAQSRPSQAERRRSPACRWNYCRRLVIGLSFLPLVMSCKRTERNRPIPSSIASGATSTADERELHSLFGRILSGVRAGDEKTVMSLIAGLRMSSSRAWLEEHFNSRLPVGNTTAREGRDDLLIEASSQVDALMLGLEDSLRVRIEEALARGFTQVDVESYRQSGDPRSTWVQSDMLRFAREPVTIFSVRLRGKAPAPNVHLYSFVRVDDSFRYLGPMPAFKRLAGHEDFDFHGREWQPDVVKEWRLRDREHFFETGERPLE